ncbi:hypothetical protein RRG08_059391 [Elysia crispata]|uniref:Uncharacterized protein n=1 Tax=Elysia crispata TaxID=231223 RepID=A0AAE1E7I8_9GAST|nr:hypothetical protein RRG08_059391 [Elysia crispata]
MRVDQMAGVVNHKILHHCSTIQVGFLHSSELWFNQEPPFCFPDRIACRCGQCIEMSRSYISPSTSSLLTPPHTHTHFYKELIEQSCMSCQSLLSPRYSACLACCDVLCVVRQLVCVSYSDLDTGAVSPPPRASRCLHRGNSWMYRNCSPAVC